MNDAPSPTRPAVTPRRSLRHRLVGVALVLATLVLGYLVLVAARLLPMS